VPSCDRVFEVLVAVGELLGARRCYGYQRAFHFVLGDGWSIAISPESANRFRISACRWSRPTATFWIFDGENDRLAAVIARLDTCVADATRYRSGDVNDFRARGSTSML
jgi:hypothetical protein